MPRSSAGRAGIRRPKRREVRQGIDLTHLNAGRGSWSLLFAEGHEWKLSDVMGIDAPGYFEYLARDLFDDHDSWKIADTRGVTYEEGFGTRGVEPTTHVEAEPRFPGKGNPPPGLQEDM